MPHRNFKTSKKIELFLFFFVWFFQPKLKLCKNLEPFFEFFFFFFGFEESVRKNFLTDKEKQRERERKKKERKKKEKEKKDDVNERGGGDGLENAWRTNWRKKRIWRDRGDKNGTKEKRRESKRENHRSEWTWKREEGEEREEEEKVRRELGGVIIWMVLCVRS